MAYASASQGGYGAGPSVIPVDAAHPDVVSISDAELLFTGHFERKGPDLVLTGHDGHHHIIPGYFSAEHLRRWWRQTAHELPATLSICSPVRRARTICASAIGLLRPWIGRVEKVVGDVTVMRNGVAVRSTSATRSTRATLSRPAPIRRPASASPTAPRSISSPTRGWRSTIMSTIRTEPRMSRCSAWSRAASPSSPARSPIPAT